MRFQGRPAWITIIKNKPTPVGYKLYTVASNGYLLDFRIFRGKGGYNSPQNVLHNTVMDLMNPWKGEHRRLYFDSLYTSRALRDALGRRVFSPAVLVGQTVELYLPTSSKKAVNFRRVSGGHGSVATWAVWYGMMPEP